MARSTSTRHQPTNGSQPKRRGKNRQIVLPGQYFFASPRTLHRRYLLKPCYETMEAMKYFIGHYGKKWGIETYAVCVMSNHYHLVGRDTKGKRPKFFQDLNRSMAKFLGTKYGWKGAIFKKMDPPVVLHSAKAVADKIGYTLANPIAAGAVRFSREWPGFITRPEDMGHKTYRAKRPKHYFGKQKTLPDTASWTLKMPDWLLETNRTEADARAEIQAAVERHEKDARAEVAAKGWKYLGAERAKKLDPFKQATSYEVFGSLTPMFSVVGLTQEEAIRVKVQFLAWQARYDDCRERYLRGETVIWPAGTWAMVEHFGQVAELA